MAWMALASIAAMLAPQSSPPDTIDVGALGAPSFHDDFQHTRICDPQLDSSCRGRHWRPDYGYAGSSPATWANHGGADAAYVDPSFPGVEGGRLLHTSLGLSPFEVTPDYLKITASPTPAADRAKLWNKPFVSGLLSSVDSYTFTYGYTEVVADLPLCTHGAWPAVWTSVNNGWPTGGEDDFPETIGTGKLWFTLHDPVNQPKNGDHAILTPPTACQRGFHRYGALKTKTWVAFYYDGQRVALYPATPDMRRPHCILLNLAMGGSWATGASGAPDQTVSTSMMVKSVDVWTSEGAARP